MPPPQKERKTIQNTARGSSVRGTIANNTRKRSCASGARMEGEDGDQGMGKADSSGHLERTQKASLKLALKLI